MITSNVSKAVYYGNDTATAFPFAFKVWNVSELIVEVTDAEDVAVVVTNWTATLTDTGGTVTYLHEGAPLPTGYTLTILRNMPFVQEVDLITGTRFDPSVIEAALDKATAERQQLFELANRAIAVPPSSQDPPELLAEEIFTARDDALTAAQSADLSAQSAEQSSQAVDAAKKNALIDITNSTQSGVERLQQEGEAQHTAMQAEVSYAKGAVEIAKAWAESDTAPDPDQPDSRSAKAWAEWLASQQGEAIPDASTTVKGKVQLATQSEVLAGTGTGVVISNDLQAKITPIVQDVTSSQNRADSAYTLANDARETAELADSRSRTNSNSVVYLENDKAETDLSNLTAAGKSAVSLLSMPTSSHFVVVTSILNETTGTAPRESTYTPPTNGWICIRMQNNHGQSTTQSLNCTLSTGQLTQGGDFRTANGGTLYFTLPCVAGREVRVRQFSDTTKVFYAIFVKAHGEV